MVLHLADFTGDKAHCSISRFECAGHAPGLRQFLVPDVAVSGPGIEAELLARECGEKTGRIYVSPYNDLEVIAGQGTIGLELFEQQPDLDAVFVSVGGGGLISGVGSALKKLSPRTLIVGVWPENSACLLRAMEAGEIVDVEESDTISDGTAGAVEPGSVTLPIARAVVDETLTVSETEIAAAMYQVAAAERWIIEGAAGVAVAGLLKSAPRFRGKRLAAVICGRNIELSKFLEALQIYGYDVTGPANLPPDVDRKAIARACCIAFCRHFRPAVMKATPDAEMKTILAGLVDKLR